MNLNTKTKSISNQKSKLKNNIHTQRENVKLYSLLSLVPSFVYHKREIHKRVSLLIRPLMNAFECILRPFPQIRECTFHVSDLILLYLSTIVVHYIKHIDSSLFLLLSISWHCSAASAEVKSKRVKITVVAMQLKPCFSVCALQCHNG